MAVNDNDVLRMSLLMGITDTTKQDLKMKYPNVTFVLEHPDPKAHNDGSFNRSLFKDIDPNVYQPFHDRLVKLNNGKQVAPPQIEGSNLERSYLAAGAMVTFVDSAFAGGAWPPGSQHPPSQTIESWHSMLGSNV